MKFAVFTLTAALFAATAPAQAQQQEQPRQPRAEARAERFDPAKRIERRVQMLDQRLNLNDDQAARIRTILTQESEQMKAQFQNRGAKRADGQRAQRSEAARDSARAQMQQHRARTDAAIIQVLNADQRSEFQKLQTEMKERGQKRGEKRGGEKRDGERRAPRAS